MMKAYFSFFILLGYYNIVNGVQPYFPSQIVFTLDNGQTTYAIDEINQQAFTSIKYGASLSDEQNSYVMKHFPYAIPDSPESKYYVQLVDVTQPSDCLYGTFWKYGHFQINSFPSHWINGSSFEVRNYMKFSTDLIRSNETSSDEDYWYSTEQCKDSMGQSFPCEEMYFRKNTDIPLRYGHLVRHGWEFYQDFIVYNVISVGQPIDQYFQSIRKDWSIACRDTTLGILIYPQTVNIDVEKQVSVEIWLTAPPHKVNGTDIVIIEWHSNGCLDCFTWTPKRLEFDIENFQIRQTLTITRVKNGTSSQLIPDFNGGGFDLVVPQIYPIYIQ